MKHSLNYGRITWSYADFDPKVPCSPNPAFSFSPIRIRGTLRKPDFTDKTALLLFKLRNGKQVSFREAYMKWHMEMRPQNLSLGEGRDFLAWLRKNNLYVRWRTEDFKTHEYFQSPHAPKHDPHDEVAKDYSFCLKSVEINKRKVKLYLKDEDVLNLIKLPYGIEEDFMTLVTQYVENRFQWEDWKAPAPSFLEWVKNQARRPLFSEGQLGLCLNLI